MTLLEAIATRHSVRKYTGQPIADDAAEALQQRIAEVNAAGRLHVQLVRNEPHAFSGGMAYGVFSGVADYLVMAAPKVEGYEERVGYYGEQLVLLAQQLGLNTCWVGLTYRKTSGAFAMADGEKLVCVIALGYGVDQGTERKHRSVDELSNLGEVDAPAWFRAGVEAARLAPTAVNQQKFRFVYLGEGPDGRARVRAERRFSLIGYTKTDLGIAKLHFEIGADGAAFDWA